MTKVREKLGLDNDCRQMDTRAANGGEPGALATMRAKAARPEVVGSNPTGPTTNSRWLRTVKRLLVIVCPTLVASDIWCAK